MVRPRTRARSRLATGIACLATALVIVATAAGPATADDPAPPSIVGGPVEGDPGVLSAEVTSDSDVTSVTALVTSSTVTPAVSLHVPLDRFSGDGTASEWRSARLAVSTYASYNVSFEATNADGQSSFFNTVDVVQAQPRNVVAAANRTNLQYPDTTVTVAGRLDRFDPITNTTAPWSKPRVTLMRLGAGITDKETTTDGSFSVSMTPGQFGTGTLVLSLAKSAGSVIQPIDIFSTIATATQSDARLTVDPPDHKANGGEPFTVTGTAEYFDGSAWQPLSGGVVQMGPKTATVGSDGHFSLTFQAPVSQPADDLSVGIDYDTTPGAVFLSSEYAVFHLDVLAQSWLVWSGFELNEYSQVHLDGHFEWGGVGPVDVQLQRSDNGTTGWTSLGTLTIKADHEFDTYAYVDKPSGYWRLYYPGDSTFAREFSQVMHASRTLTRIIHLNASPEPVHKGHLVTVQGTAQKQSHGAWVASKGHRVDYYFRPHGSNKYTYVGHSTTSSAHGHFRKAFTATKDGSWSAVWWTTSDSYLTALSSEDYVNVS